MPSPPTSPTTASSHLSMGLRQALISLRPDDPLVRWMIDESKSVDVDGGLVRAGTNVAWLGRASRPGERWITALGEDDAVVVRLVQELASAFDVDGVTVPDTAFELLPAELTSPDPGHWCLWTRPADSDGLNLGEARVIDAGDERIAGLLAYSSSAHVFPGDPRVVEWVGCEEGERLVAVAARMSEGSGAAHIVSVCTAPDARGRGLAADCCSRLILGAIEQQAPVIVLEMYVGNEAGRSLYTRLGFTEVGRYMSGLLAGAHD